VRVSIVSAARDLANDAARAAKQSGLTYAASQDTYTRRWLKRPDADDPEGQRSGKADGRYGKPVYLVTVEGDEDAIRGLLDATADGLSEKWPGRCGVSEDDAVWWTTGRG
jgi:hypothetical protein